WEMQVNERSGPEWMAAVCAPAMALKQHMSTLEMSHPLGRLWDIDIIDSDGKSLSRRELGHPARPCLICQQDAHLCARGKHHTLDLLLDEIARRIECYERERCD
ncbi:citrate lyase holo-[acyl-carrier protein] synthase, partial [Salmonella enterica subsp. enterica]|nr:citrate lyase holo-[acyl-carrier protein] synthase [Salmonella enterica subsp. enterica serovar Javiana]EBY7872050.1 citrate lyase holo-[acyl-carrier protein] synthase [Salmonella enterica subsp. enterica serovar Javiana]EDQ9687896.1 citrate lyase holo-[acyl-carrier protein] synthase [Salmonella enterica subsp. enterica serovar Javiana]EDS5407549.1 citrate lyase holo-[acyl-carrier protein] synthase [Salmonella enterica subsp. enterica serovar Javiana]EDW4668264.1 citrate lyase holo-[acyl-car